MLGYVSMASTGWSPDRFPGASKQLARIESNARTSRPSSARFSTSSPSTRQTAIEISDFDVRELLEEVYSELEPAVRLSSLRVTLDMRPIWADCKRSQEGQTDFLNSSQHALKFTHKARDASALRLSDIQGVQMSVSTPASASRRSLRRGSSTISTARRFATRAFGGIGAAYPSAAAGANWWCVDWPSRAVGSGARFVLPPSFGRIG